MKKNTISVILAAVLFFSFVSIADAALVYTVKKGDTLYKIARSHNLSVEAVLSANPELKDENELKPGTALVIPDDAEETIPLDSETTETHTLIVHGSSGTYNPPVEKTINTMTVNGKSVKVPTYKKPVKKAPKRYRDKYSKLSSRGTVKGNSIVKTAFRYIGVPYVFGGSTPRAFDCSGFTQYVYRQCGIKTPRMAHHQYYAGTPVSKKNLRPGDMVFFETYTKGISHVGIFIGNGKFIHASSRGAVRVDSLSKPYYINHYRGAARY